MPFCTDCGDPVDLTDTYCYSCGRKIEHKAVAGSRSDDPDNSDSDNPEPVEPASGRATTRKRGSLWRLALGVVIMLLGGLWLVAFWTAYDQGRSGLLELVLQGGIGLLTLALGFYVADGGYWLDRLDRHQVPDLPNEPDIDAYVCDSCGRTTALSPNGACSYCGTTLRIDPANKVFSGDPRYLNTVEDSGADLPTPEATQCSACGRITARDVNGNCSYCQSDLEVD